MKPISLLLFIMLLSSCEFYNTEKTSSKDILTEELQSFNWKEVDEYPAFETCNSVESQSERKTCFEKTLTTNIADYLKEKHIVVTRDINDTIRIKFNISDKGQLTLLDMQSDSLTVFEIPNLKSYIEESLSALPKIYPAIKRGQQVKTQFILPIVIQMN